MSCVLKSKGNEGEDSGLLGCMLCRLASVSELLEGTVGDTLEGEGSAFLRNVRKTVSR
jgi:hypothetical protein